MARSAADQAPALVRETTGLTWEEAARRLAHAGPNDVAPRKPVRLRNRILAQLTDPLIMVSSGPSCSPLRPVLPVPSAGSRLFSTTVASRPRCPAA
ncbi:cation-transporting P-type ATPase [Streptomyces sp. NPDC058583]|uniref:cation-transporting P-type ATPase n=1 Tax=unclassified Streptomyces TaxID=2593676 RepID=UPI00365FD6E4